MTTPSEGRSQPGSAVVTLAMLLLFVGSGAAALIYEVVWFHLIGLVIGISAVSLAVLLTSFMGGMCLGSIAFPRLISARRHPLRVYALLELGIGAYGVGLYLFLPSVGQLYTKAVGYGYVDQFLRGVVCLICLLPPTVLMGATLPAIARWMESSRTGLSKLGFFYGANIAGAVIGSVTAGFYLLRVYDTWIATLVAASVNGAIAVLGLLLSFGLSYKQASPPAEEERRPVEVFPSVYFAIALSGLTALGAEVVWTRLLSLLFGATVYTFAIILAVFLMGLGIGSSVGSLLTRVIRSPRAAFGWCQALLVVSIPFAAHMIIEKIPYWDPDPNITADIWRMFQHDVMRAGAAILPAAIFWGASFPLALAGAGARHEDTGRLVGGVYAANTVGAIAGSLLFTFVGIPVLGSQRAQQALAILAAFAAFLMFASQLVAPAIRAGSDAPQGPRHPVLAWMLVIITGGALFGWSFWTTTIVPPVPAPLIAYGHQVHQWGIERKYPYLAEGVSSSVAVSSEGEHDRLFHINGKVEASSLELDLRLQKMLGHLPALIHPEPKSVLIVGCGAGCTAGTFVLYPSIKRIVICELEPRVPEAAQKYFSVENNRVLDDPRTQVIFDDARHFMATTNEKFDIITSDPVHPWVRGAAALYSQNYYELVRDHLNPGGVVTQWIPLYQTSPEAVKSEMATFLGVFKGGTAWSSDLAEVGYDLVALGQAEPTVLNVDEIEKRLEGNKAVKETLENSQLGSIDALMMSYAGRDKELKPWFEDAQINNDRSLRLQYLAGLAMRRYEEDAIFGAMHDLKTFPEGLFVGSPETIEKLKKAFGEM